MVNPLIFIHAGFGEIGAVAFLWVLVECLNPSEASARRARIAALVGMVCLLVAWVAGGYYYVNIYGAEIKPAIVASDANWIHGIVMEVKEHVFLFLPILAILTSSLIGANPKAIIDNRDTRVSVQLLSGLIFLLGFGIAAMGALIASGYRFALQAGVS